LKFDSSGELSWAKTVGGTNHDRSNSAFQTSDGGYISAGWTNSFGAGYDDLFLVKFDSLGEVSWAKTVGGVNYDEGSSVFQTSDGGYIVTGYTESFGAGSFDFVFLRFDSAGNLSWAKTVGGIGDDKGFSVSQTSDGGYIVTGYTGSYGAGSLDLFLLRFDSEGNLSWAKTVGGTGDDRGYSVSQTSDGGYIVTGYTESFGAGAYDFWLLKFDSSGELSWVKTVGGTGNDGGYLVSQTSDSGYIITGETNSFGAGGFDTLLLKFNSSGNILDCPFVSSQSLTAAPQSLTAVSQSLTAAPQSLTAVSQSLTAVSQTFTVNTQCPSD